MYEEVADHKYGVAGKRSFIKCQKCGIVYLDPRLVNSTGGAEDLLLCPSNGI